MPQLLKRSLKIIICLICSIIISQQFIYSQTYPSPLSSEGGVDTHLYKCDTVMFEATALEDGSCKIEERTFYAGLSMLHSPYLSIFYIPLKYDLNNYFRIIFSLPYLTKTLVYNDTHYIKSGYGDTMLGFTGSFSPFNAFTSSTTARMTLPTGNVNAQDFDYYIPMGYGGYITSIQESISTGNFNIGFTNMRLFMSGIYIYYFTSTQKADTSEKFTFDRTYSWSVMGGVELVLTTNLNIQFKTNYIFIPERKYKSSSSQGEWTEADDSIRQINVLPFIKYRFLDDITGQAGLIYPVKTTQDSEVSHSYEPEWKIAWGVEKKFCDRNSSSGKQKTKI
ncbi:MAG TPA: hypothetical protein PK358_04905 [Spirochaetota bacterium]|nr:hypothetical protein [Spirochaetota bacterium]HPJ34152.1 hypothetical protein [Spirochaetota bacterium]